jgi:hypothetical protein
MMQCFKLKGTVTLTITVATVTVMDMTVTMSMTMTVNMTVTMSMIVSMSLTVTVTMSMTMLQMLQKKLEHALEELDKQIFKDSEGRRIVPPHLVNLRLGNRQHVMVGGGHSFGSWTMTEILAKADLFADILSSSSNVLNEDLVMRARLQHSALVWDIMYR